MAEKKESVTKVKSVTKKLSEVLRIKDDLESNIKRDEFLMRKNNSTPAENKNNIDLDVVKDRYELSLEQLILVKDAIRKGNADTDESNVNNDHRIYTLSNLNRRKAFLNSLNTFEGSRPTMTSNGKEIEFKAHFNYNKIYSEIKKIDSEIRKLENALADFNHSKEVTFDIYTELGIE